MKGLVMAALLLLCLGSSEALRCYSCLFDRGVCGSPDKGVCEDPLDMCVTVINKFPEYIFMKSCMTPEKVAIVSARPQFRVETCTFDLCN